MFDGIIFTEKNLTDEDLNTISFIMRINKPMKYIELETTSGFKRKFLIDNKKSKYKNFCSWHMVRSRIYNSYR